ncbi:HK97 gp10 family phage protein [Sphingomonas sanguinis]|uniref:HK97 gp10 family phage protein n=1 Tax=Sphingomonas sp. LC-1 TaxID=3110957 RepID=UPI0021BADEC1|nr:HK97 gp10 family phage protein [Sphingomonas sp. LC-1]MCT8002387.1 HK97 gp10 family phage protein [Sphingomonas sp. LC-1]
MGRGGLRRLITRLEQDIAPAVTQGARIIEDQAKGLIMQGSSSFMRHVVSRPGEPPNNDLGDLIRGIDHVELEPLHALVVSTAGHAAPLEFGTSKMAARPYMAPAADMRRKEVANLVARAASIAIRKSGNS